MFINMLFFLKCAATITCGLALITVLAIGSNVIALYFLNDEYYVLLATAAIFNFCSAPVWWLKTKL